MGVLARPGSLVLRPAAGPGGLPSFSQRLCEQLGPWENASETLGRYLVAAGATASAGALFRLRQGVRRETLFQKGRPFLFLLSKDPSDHFV